MRTKARDWLTFIAGVFILYFVPFVLVCAAIGFIASRVFDVDGAIASFIAFLGIQVLFGLLDFISAGAIGVRRFLNRSRNRKQAD